MNKKLKNPYVQFALLSLYVLFVCFVVFSFPPEYIYLTSVAVAIWIFGSWYIFISYCNNEIHSALDDELGYELIESSINHCIFEKKEVPVVTRKELEAEFYTDKNGKKYNLEYYNPETRKWNVRCLNCESIHEQHNYRHTCEKCYKGGVELESRRLEGPVKPVKGVIPRGKVILENLSLQAAGTQEPFETHCVYKCNILGCQNYTTTSCMGKPMCGIHLKEVIRRVIKIKVADRLWAIIGEHSEFFNEPNTCGDPDFEHIIGDLTNWFEELKKEVEKK